MWRRAISSDDDDIVDMCLALNQDDPGPEPVPRDFIRKTLWILRREPVRGCAVVLDLGQGPIGYAFLISFWSNELGGEVRAIDEIYVRPEWRGQGSAQELVNALSEGTDLWPGMPVALELEVSDRNHRARKLYERLGFAPIHNTMMRCMLPAPVEVRTAMAR